MILYRPIEVNLIKMRYNYLIKQFNICDITLLNELFAHINPKLKISRKDIYLQGRNDIFKNEAGESIIFQSDKNWTIEIAIQGFKTTNGGRVSPIWKMIDAQII